MRSGIHKTWWQKNWDSRLIDLQNWLEASDLSSREYVHLFAKSKRIKRILDVGPGVLTDWNLYWKDSTIKYHVCDVTPQVVDLAEAEGIPAKIGDIEALPYEDGEFSLVYCRHVWEHLEYYERALDEMLRVSSKYVVVVLWLLGEHDSISYTKDKLYQNTYGVRRLNSVLEERGLKYKWVEGNDKILTIEK